LVEALKFHGEEKICELNITSRRVEEIVEEITDILEGNKKCGVGIVDWLRKLEKENLLDEYMKF
jgi:broad-specificity NMP kinase